MAVLGLRFCARAFSSCGERGPLFIAVRGPLTIAASLVAKHRLQTHRLSNCGSRAQLLRGMWDLPRPGLEPLCPALAGRFSTTAPPGKPMINVLTNGIWRSLWMNRPNLICHETIRSHWLSSKHKIRWPGCVGNKHHGFCLAAHFDAAPFSGSTQTR